MAVSNGRVIAVALIVVLVSFGCAPQPINPSLPITADCAHGDLQRMDRSPKRLDRPLVIISGFMDPGFAAVPLRSTFRAATGDSRILIVTLFECCSFDDCRRKLVRSVNRAFPSGNPKETTEVDVIGYSMGGLVARLAANPLLDNVQRLCIHRLFTISTPHRGAKEAKELPLLHPLQADMRPGSALIVRLNATPILYEVYCYVRLGDHPVGVRNAVIPDGRLWWVSAPPFSNPHLGAPYDPRILADIARRLRDEPPLASTPPAPPPEAGPKCPG
jgi:pimeloyl-ACP methyl ester carboxylesterase